MPATFPSHQAVVLPLKVWRPRWFDGVALCVGAASPDVSYLVDGSGIAVWPVSHRPLGLVVWCLPVTVAVCWLFRRAAATVAAHLPVGGPFALRDYGVLSVSGHRWHGPAPDVPRRPALFWSTGAVVCTAGMAVTPALPGALLPHTTGVRLITAVALGLMAGAATVSRARPVAC